MYMDNFRTNALIVRAADQRRTIADCERTLHMCYHRTAQIAPSELEIK